MEIYIAQEALKIIDLAPGFICIKACSLDDAGDLRPEFHVYVRSKQPWDRVEDELPQFSEDF
jgi:hypothetical protein